MGAGRSTGASPRRGRAAGLRALTLGLALVLGCSGEDAREAHEVRGRGSASIGGDVVSTVDGMPITKVDVARVAAETGLDPEASLRRLQELELLAAEAQRRGGAESARVRRVERQSMTQRLLAEAEQAVTPESVSDAEVLEAWRSRRGADAPEPSQAVKDDIRAQLVKLRRFAWVRELVERLETERGVQRNAAAIEAASRLELAGGEPE